MHRYLARLAAALALVSASALAQDYPSRAVSLVVPFAAGGPLDAEARLLAQFFEKAWGKPVTVEPRPGAGGMVGTEAVVRAAPDGHTLLFSTATLTSMRVFFKDLRFDPLKDLAPVSLVVDFPGGFVTNTKIPVRTIEEFVAYAKANPGAVNYGSLGRATPKLLFEAFARDAGIRLTEVPYQGTAPAQTALIRNDVQIANITLHVATKALVDAGQLRPLLMIGTRRARTFPDVPTSAEKGWNLPSNGWSGVLAPAATPRPIIDRIAAEIARYVTSADARKQSQDTGVDKVSSTPDELRKIIENSMRVWAETAASIGLQPE